MLDQWHGLGRSLQDDELAARREREARGELDELEVPARLGLVTSRGRRRWLIPKGWPMAGRKELEQLGTDHVTCSRAAADFPASPGTCRRTLAKATVPSRTISSVLGREAGQRARRPDDVGARVAYGHLLDRRSLRFPRVHVNEPACKKHEQTGRAKAGSQHGVIDSNSNKPSI